MRLIVDCYNVLHATMPPVLAGLDEAGLCRALARTTWASHPGGISRGNAAGAGIVVVADGRPKPLRAVESPVPEVELVFAGQTPGSHRSADDLIIQLINQHSAPRRLTVVSSDRQIRAAARRRKARDLSSDDFIDKLVDQLRRHAHGPPPPDRPDVAPLPPEHVERWKEHFGLATDATPPEPAGASQAAPASSTPPAAHARFAESVDAHAIADLEHDIGMDTIRRSIAAGRYVVAIDDGGVVGVLRFEMIWESVPFISLVFVSPPHRGRGHSRRMLDALCAHLRRLEHTTLMSSSRQDEPTPQRWHAHMGFVPNGRFDQLPGQPVPEMIFALTL
ncbi:MAG: NYN domain-containing protein [Planctomycetota bacterium]